MQRAHIGIETLLHTGHIGLETCFVFCMHRSRTMDLDIASIRYMNVHVGIREKKGGGTRTRAYLRLSERLHTAINASQCCTGKRARKINRVCDAGVGMGG